MKKILILLFVTLLMFSFCKETTTNSENNTNNSFYNKGTLKIVNKSKTTKPETGTIHRIYVNDNWEKDYLSAKSYLDYITNGNSFVIQDLDAGNYEITFVHNGFIIESCIKANVNIEKGKTITLELTNKWGEDCSINLPKTSIERNTININDQNGVLNINNKNIKPIEFPFKNNTTQNVSNLSDINKYLGVSVKANITNKTSNNLIFYIDKNVYPYKTWDWNYSNRMMIEANSSIQIIEDAPLRLFFNADEKNNIKYIELEDGNFSFVVVDKELVLISD